MFVQRDGATFQVNGQVASFLNFCNSLLVDKAFEEEMTSISVLVRQERTRGGDHFYDSERITTDDVEAA